MKRLMIGLIALVFIIPSAGLSLAEEHSYHAGELTDCKARKFITIKDDEGNIVTFEMTEAAWDGKRITRENEWRRCEIEKGSVWLVARGHTVIYASKLPDRVTIREIEEMIKDIRQVAINWHIKERRPVTEHGIVRSSWTIAATESHRDPSNEVKRQVRIYFYNLAMEATRVD